MPTCLVVQHAAPEPAWGIADALARAGVTLDVRRTFADEAVPDDVSRHDGLVVMGGPMSAASDDGFGTRAAELRLIGAALDAGVPTFGVCLGAQLVALAAGGAVAPGQDGQEIGWAPVDLSPACDDDPLFRGLPGRLTVLHWHGETFALPPGAQHLAGNARYANQAFRVGDAAWGTQFHAEVTAPAVEGFLRAFAADADASPGGAAAIRRDMPAALAALAPWRDLLFDRFVAMVAAASGGSPRRFAEISDP